MILKSHKKAFQNHRQIIAVLDFYCTFSAVDEERQNKRLKIDPFTFNQIRNVLEKRGGSGGTNLTIIFQLP